MTRLAQSLVNDYPRKFIWYMECDACKTTRSAPEWTVDALPLERFRAEGWRCEPKGKDTCPGCLEDSK